MAVATTLVLLGGVFNLAFAVFHLFFWRIFSWKTELRELSSINQAIVQVLNLCLIFVFAIFALLSFVFPHDLVSTSLGKAVLALVALFWLLRAVEQAVYFRLRHWASWAFLFAFLGGAALYASALAVAP